jgi:hypothetical protein
MNHSSTAVCTAQTATLPRAKRVRRPPPAACWALGLAAALLLTQSGCALVLVGGAAAAGAGTYAYVEGEVRSTLDAGMDQTWRASEAAIKELELTSTSNEKDALAARIVARGAGDKKIELKLKRIADTATEVRVRVGTFGDKSLSSTILDRVKKHLKD